jgi:ABC-type phosphate/phosphonate transport system substrate-binding protein
VARFLPAAETKGAGDDLTVLVMDPLDKELSCPCVKGYAQRDYDQLGNHLAQKLKRPVTVVHSESLVAATKSGKLPTGVDVIIGKRSVVEYDARQSQTNVTAIAALTGKDGLTTQLGLIVVPSKDPAKTVADLKNYRIIFGPEDCDEKYKAAIAVLKQQGISLPEKLETCAACADGATKILELGDDVRAATVISSYAAPLLEGCGTIQKGDLRVVGKTAPVPFITAFTTSRVTESDRNAIKDVLIELIEAPKLCIALETQQGFVALADQDGLAKKK